VLERRHLKRLLYPIVRVFLRHASSIHEFHALARDVFVEVAAEEIRKSSPKVNVSRISAMTGLYRREVTKILREGKSTVSYEASIIARVLGRWQTDSTYLTSSKRPRVLPFRAAKGSFSELVYSVSRDTHDGTILNELKRAGLVDVSERGVSLLKREALIPGDVDRAIEIVANNIETCILSGEENMSSSSDLRNLHLRTSYTKVPTSKLPEIRKWILERGVEFHRGLREYLSQLRGDPPETESIGEVADSDTAPTTARVAVMSTSLIELDDGRPAT
jgi:hypothetical protein